MNKLLLDLNLTNMNKKQNQQSISQSNSYSRTFIQPASFISKDKVVKPRYIHKEKTPTNRIQILHDESPLAYEYDNNKQTFRKIEDNSYELTSKSSIKQTLRLNLKYQDALKENQLLKDQLIKAKQQLKNQKQHTEQSTKKFSSMVHKIFMVLNSLKESMEQSEEDPADTLEFIHEKVESILQTLDHYPFNN